MTTSFKVPGLTWVQVGSGPGCDIRIGTTNFPALAAQLWWNPVREVMTVVKARGAAIHLADNRGSHFSLRVGPDEPFSIGSQIFSLSPDGVVSCVGQIPDPRTRIAILPRENSLNVDSLVIPIGTRGKGQKILSLSFQAPMHTVIALCAPSGTGKTILLRMLMSAREGAHNSPSVFLGATPLMTRGKNSRHVAALVPQEEILPTDLTLREILLGAYWLKRGSSGDRGVRARTLNRAIHLASLTDLVAERAGDHVDSFSGGQRKRISLAMELMRAPDLLLLDEPNTGLDPAGDKALMESLDLVARTSSTRVTIVVTHNLCHLPDDSFVVLMGRRPWGTREVAYANYLPGMYASFGLEPGDDATLMTRLEEGNWDSDDLDAGDDPSGEDASFEAEVSSGRMRNLIMTQIRKLGSGVVPYRPNESPIINKLRVWGLGRLKTVWITVLFPIVAVLLAQAVLRGEELGVSKYSISAVLVILTVVGFGGVGLTVSGVVDEVKLLGRESTWGVKAWQQVLSRFVAAGLPSVVMGFLTAILTWGLIDVGSEVVISHELVFLALLLPLYCLSCAALGLAVSSLVRGTRSTVFLLMGFLSLFVLLSGVPMSLEGISLLPIVATIMPSYWAGAAWAAQIDLEGVNPLDDHGPVWESTYANICWNCVWLGVCTIGYLIIASLVISRRVPKVVLNQ